MTDNYESRLRARLGALERAVPLSSEAARTSQTILGRARVRSAATAKVLAGIRVTGARPSRGTAGSLIAERRRTGLAVAFTAVFAVVAAGGLLGVRALSPAAVSESPSAGNPVSTGNTASAIDSGGTFAATGSLLEAQMWPSATTLEDGRVLVTGGLVDTSSDVNALDPVPVAPEIYDPATGKFSKTGAMVQPRFWSTATLLADGRVLIVGGRTQTETMLNAELYDPKTGTFSEAGSTAVPRVGPSATLLADGRVLIAGGDPPDPAGRTAEVYDPRTEKFSVTGSMVLDRHAHSATLLADGRVLLVGGYKLAPDGSLPEGALNTTSAELYNPTFGTFSATGSLAAAMFQPKATRLPDGRVLVEGDPNGYTAEVYDPSSGKFAAAGFIGSAYSLDAVLPDGLVLLAGGYEVSHGSLASALLYNPETGTFSPTGSMITRRYNAGVAQLADGRVLVLGGHSNSGDGEKMEAGITDTAEIYTEPNVVPSATPGSTSTQP
jgi:hypothetical protein